MLFWNEGRSVRTARSLAEGEKTVVAVTADRVDPAHESALVHVSGKAVTDETIKDPQFAVASKALRLVRDVKVYQWTEKQETRTRRKVGGGEERTTQYTYTKGWSNQPIDSSRFKVPAGHENPREWRFRGWSGEAGVVTLGAFRLPSDLVRQINKFEPLRVDEAARGALPEDLRDKLRLDNGRFYQGSNPAEPQVGDVAVEFRQVLPTEVSLLAQQVAGSFQPFQTKSGDAINRLQLGVVSAADMFHAAEAENSLRTWVFRLVGFVLMSVGIGMVLRPLAVFGDVIPFIGNVIRFGTGSSRWGPAWCCRSSRSRWAGSRSGRWSGWRSWRWRVWCCSASSAWRGPAARPPRELAAAAAPGLTRAAGMQCLKFHCTKVMK